MRTFLRMRFAVSTVAISAATLILVGSSTLEAHDDEARYVRDLGWTTDQIARTLAMSHDLGLRGIPPSAKVVTVGGHRCVEAGLLGFDVVDEFAFDVDEPIELQILFAAPGEVTFALAYDKNGTAGAVSHHLALKGVEGDWSRASIVLERARFANRGARATDFAIASSYEEAEPPRRGGQRNGQRPAAICQIRLSRRGVAPPPPDFGGLELTLEDPQTGRPTAARVGLYDETGRMPLPSGSSVPVRSFTELIRQLPLRPQAFWPVANRWVFYVGGTYRARVPAGEYVLVAMKGPEYRLIVERFKIARGSTRRIVRTFERWTDMPGRGWYSGDTHIHTRRRDRIDDERVMSLIDAEDLWVGSTLLMGNIRKTYFEQRWGEPGRYERAGRHLVPGQEDPRTGRHGHALSLNLQRPVRNRQRYFLFHEVVEEVHRQGGLSGYAHLHRGWFNALRGMALDLPFGIIDFVEVLQGVERGCELGTEAWYGYLNLGFKLAPTAGSDYPYLDLPGEVRSYVHVDGEPTAESWYRGLRAGRAFVTNGPMLELDVDGRGMGDELHVARGTRLRVRARADLNPDFGRLSALELIVHGEVVDQAASREGAQSLALDHTLTVGQSLWLAVRARGERGTGAALAHSSPVYLIVDGSPFWKRAEVRELVEKQLYQLRRLDDARVTVSAFPERWEAWETESAEWARQRPLLEGRVAEARARYRALLRRVDPPGAPAP